MLPVPGREAADLPTRGGMPVTLERDHHPAATGGNGMKKRQKNESSHAL
jgi:hypothetical protein